MKRYIVRLSSVLVDHPEHDPLRSPGPDPEGGFNPPPHVTASYGPVSWDEALALAEKADSVAQIEPLMEPSEAPMRDG